VDLSEKFRLFRDYWSPKIVGELNDSYVKLVKLKGEFVWHHHRDEDELFLVTKGRWFLLSNVPLLGALVYRYVDRRLPGARTSAVARTRLIDDEWRQAQRDGIRQIVILGSGFDCRAYRLSGEHSPVVFEVDRPITVASKRERLRGVLRTIPQNVRFVEVDFNRQSLGEALTGARFDSSVPALFLWEGVTSYLTPEAVDSVLRYVGSTSPGSRLVFTYVHSGALDSSMDFEGAQRTIHDVARLGEPWRFGLSPDQVPDFLRKRGLEPDRDVGAREFRALYFGRDAERMKGYDFYHVVTAHVPGGAQRPHPE